MQTDNVDAIFKIQTLHEAKTLAASLAKQCPNQPLAAVGIREVLINAIEHGNLGITYTEKNKLDQIYDWLPEIERRLKLPENRNKFVTVVFHKTADHISIRITDAGNGFNWQKYQTVHCEQVMHNHGRGLIMARDLAFDEMIYRGSGNDVECIIKR